MTEPILGVGPDATAPFHYGNPTAEARALERGTGLVDLSHFDVVTLTGPERLTWLHLFTTQHIAELAPGTSTEALILDPHGHIQHAFFLIDDGATSFLITDTERGEGLVTFLESMKFAADVEIAMRDDVVTLGTLNPLLTPVALRAVLAEATIVEWDDPWPVTGEVSTRYGVADDEHPGSSWKARLTVVASDAVGKLKEQWEGAGGTLAGMWAWEAARIAAWRPRLALDVDDRGLPHELDWLRSSTHLEKGCYRGQETVARVVNLGRPPRRLVFLHVDGSEHHLPQPGAEVFAGERPAGVLTSSARHHELGPIALALVRRATDPEAVLTVDGMAASQEVIVPVSGESTARPSERPGAELRGNRAVRPPAGKDLRGL